MTHDLRAKIIKSASEKSYGLIAQELELTRSTVAGVIWRYKNPKLNKCGRGRHGPGSWAQKNLVLGRRAA